MEFPIANVKRISNTQVELYSGCPLAWWFHYVLKIKTLPSIYLLLGAVIHESLSDFFTDKILGIELMSTKDLKEYTHAKLDAMVSVNKFAIPRTGKSVEEIVDSRINALGIYVETVGKHLNPIKTEYSILKPLPNTSIDFIGIIDLITQENVIDFKVCGKSWGPKKIREAIQPCAYSFLLGRPLDFQFHFISSDSPPKVVDTHITVEAANMYAERAGNLAMAMCEVALGRQKPTMCTNACSEYTCDYMEACQYYKYELYDDLMELSPVKEEKIVTIDGEDASDLFE